MTEKVGSFSISPEQSTDIYRQLMTGSGTRRPKEQFDRESLKIQLGIDKTTTSSPEGSVLGMLLIAYVNTTTRLIGMLENEDSVAINQKIHEHLMVRKEETPQQTFERLLKIATENSQKINSQRDF